MMMSDYNIEISENRKSIILTFDNEYSITGSWGVGFDCDSVATEEFSSNLIDIYSAPNVEIKVHDPEGKDIPFKGKNTGKVTPEEFVSIAYRVSSIGKEIVDE
tara:strand:+ start:1023 stop:1331 length:309 start_codon:yes stop_codon:yes gene_type:complete